MLPPGSLQGAACSGDHDCASKNCSCPHCSCHQCSNQPPGCGPGVDDGSTAGVCGVCSATTAANELPYTGASLDSGSVGLTTHTDAALGPILQRIAAQRQAEEQREEKFGEQIADLAQALTAALSWRHIWTGPCNQLGMRLMTGINRWRRGRSGAAYDLRLLLDNPHQTRR